MAVGVVRFAVAPSAPPVSAVPLRPSRPRTISSPSVSASYRVPGALRSTSRVVGVPGAAKVALTAVALLTVTLQVAPVPLQPPSQPVNTEPPVAAAVRTTGVPAGYVSAQSPGHAIQATPLATVPVPEPARATVRANPGASGVTGFDADDSGPLPTPLVACTVQV